MVFTKLAQVVVPKGLGFNDHLKALKSAISQLLVLVRIQLTLKKFL